MISTRIKITLTIIACICTTIATPSCVWEQGTRTDQPKKVIFETDMCLDVDDVGALATLHAMADSGEVEILAVCFNEVHKSGVAAIDAINTWYNRGTIPVGIYKGKLNEPDNSKYLDYVAEFPHDLTNETAPSALDVYLQVLGEQPDKSVTIISVGFLNNIYDLLKADRGLIARKVTELVVMGGLRGDDFNLVRHYLVDQSEYILRNWPTPLVISHHGGSVRTGAKLSAAPAENPVREAYYRWFDKKYQGRSSWDQLAVLYGVRGVAGYFDKVTSGKGELRNEYEWEMKPGFRSHLDAQLSDDELADIIEDLMIKPPWEATSSVSGESVRKWDVFELELSGPSTGNPFLDVTLTASFTHGDSAIRVNGFYDGDGTYRVRFMPPEQGSWSYVTSRKNGGQAPILRSLWRENRGMPHLFHRAFGAVYSLFPEGRVQGLPKEGTVGAVREPPVGPHPNPLPAGEGTEIAASRPAGYLPSLKMRFMI